MSPNSRSTSVFGRRTLPSAGHLPHDSLLLSHRKRQRPQQWLTTLPFARARTHTHTHTHMHARARAHARTHAHTHTHTKWSKKNVCIMSTIYVLCWVKRYTETIEAVKHAINLEIAMKTLPVRSWSLNGESILFAWPVHLLALVVSKCINSFI